MSVLTDLNKLRAEVDALVARHDSTRSVSDFAKYADDPVGFMRDVLRCEPWSKQIEMAERVRDNPRTIVVTANGIGKDWNAARIALWHVYARRGFCILTGPTERQVKQILMREVRRAFAVAQDLPGELFSLELRVSDDCGLLAFTSDNADKLVGFHHPRLLVCITEGQGVDEDAYEAARACCTGPENRLFVYGNPTNPTGPFYRAANSGAWSQLTVPADAHPNVVTGRNEIPGAVSREFIDAMREEYGASSSIYGSRVLARFPSESIEGLIKREWLVSAAERFASGALEDAARRCELVCALDVSRFGGDLTALTFAQGPIVREIVTWRGLSITETAERTMQHAERFGESRRQHPRALPIRPLIVVDTIGLGAGVYDILKSKGWPCREFNASARSSDSTRYLNLRSEAHWGLRELLENGRVAIPHTPTLNEEAAALEWHVNTGGQIQILSKDLIRAALGRSPDTCDSVVMALATTMRALGNRTLSLSTYSIGG